MHQTKKKKIVVHQQGATYAEIGKYTEPGRWAQVASLEAEAGH